MPSLADTAYCLQMTFSPVTLKGWAAIIPWARTGILFCKISTSLEIETHSVTISASFWKSNYSTLLLDGSSYLTNHSIITSFFFKQSLFINWSDCKNNLGRYLSSSFRSTGLSEGWTEEAKGLGVGWVGRMWVCVCVCDTGGGVCNLKPVSQMSKAPQSLSSEGLLPSGSFPA